MSFMKLTRLTGSDRNWRLIRSLLTCMAYFCHGWGLGTVGPTMLDIQILTKTTLEMATYTIIGRAAGIAVGSVMSGPILNTKLDKQLYLGVALLIAGISEATVPYVGTIEYTIGVFFINGMSFGCIESTVTTYCAFLWGPECEPFMQALQFFFGVGASIAPLFATLFLLPIDEENPDKWTPEDVKIHICYDVVGGLCLIVSFAVLCIYKFVDPSPEHPDRRVIKAVIRMQSKTESTNGEIELEDLPPAFHTIVSKLSEVPEEGDTVTTLPGNVSSPPVVVRQISYPILSRQTSFQAEPVIIVTHKNSVSSQVVENPVQGQELVLKVLKPVILSLLTLFMFFYCGIEIAFGSYLTTYAVKCPLHLAKSTGALISAVFWITFTFSRLLTIFYIKFLGSAKNLILCIGFMIVSNIFLLPFENIEWCLWTGSALIGIGTSSIWGSVFGYLEKKFHLSSFMIGSLVTAACLGECVIPIFMSYTIDKSTKIFLWITLGCTLAMVILLLLVLPLGFLFSKISQQKKSN